MRITCFIGVCPHLVEVHWGMQVHVLLMHVVAVCRRVQTLTSSSSLQNFVNNVCLDFQLRIYLENINSK